MPERANLAGLQCIQEISIHADGAEVRRATDWLEAMCRENQVPPAQVDRLLLCLNEVLANVIAHGGSRTPPVTLRLEINPDEERWEASVTVSDGCKSFDPLSIPKRVRPASLDEAPTRGMGLEILRGCSDVLQYRHEGGRNHLTFGTRWKQ